MEKQSGKKEERSSSFQALFKFFFTRWSTLCVDFPEKSKRQVFCPSFSSLFFSRKSYKS